MTDNDMILHTFQRILVALRNGNSLMKQISHIINEANLYLLYPKLYYRKVHNVRLLS